MATNILVRRQVHPGGAWNIGLWVLQIIGAVMFIPSGVQKLVSDPMAIQTFEQIGWGQWLRIAVGFIEIIGGAFLIIPSLAGIGALMLTALMAAAVLLHLFLIGGNPLNAILLLVAMAAIAYGRREIPPGQSGRRPRMPVAPTF